MIPWILLLAVGYVAWREGAFSSGVFSGVQTTGLNIQPPLQLGPSADGPNYITDRPVTPVPGTTYFGNVGSLGLLGALVSVSAVQSALAGKRFTNVQVYTDPSQLPASWPSLNRTGSMFVQATYSGAAGVPVSIPSQVIGVWT